MEYKGNKQMLVEFKPYNGTRFLSFRAVSHLLSDIGEHDRERVLNLFSPSLMIFKITHFLK